MFDFSKKTQPEYGIIDAADDGDIEIQQMRSKSRQGLMTESFKLIRDIILVVAILGLAIVFIAQPVVVEGNSMYPQLHDGERLIVNKLIYYKLEGVSWGHIQRGDIVVFWYPKDPDKSYVKRVIGLPGDTVEMRNGKVFINGQEMDEKYLDPSVNQAASSFTAKKVEEHYYFVMGDNRDNSSDSRIWGLVPEKYIYGKVFFRYWVPSNIGFVTKGAFDLHEVSADNDKKVQNDIPE